MQEFEAKTKWCPMFRLAGENGNADADGGRRTKCIASACMMWRWQRVDVPTLNENMPGHCGLAGTPWDALGAARPKPETGE